MKEEDLKKNLDKIIIDGLIKEAQQENADFEAAMKKMSNEDFLELIMDHDYIIEETYEEAEDYAEEVINPESVSVCSPLAIEIDPKERVNSFDVSSRDSSMISEDFMEPLGFHHKSEALRANYDRQSLMEKSGEKRTFRNLKPWLTSALIAAACVLAIVLPAVHHANAKLCDGVLMMSRQYLPDSKESLDFTTASNRQFDFISATEAEVQKRLPNLEKNYRDCIKKDGKFVIYTPELQECGWELTMAYLKLHKKGKAIDVLRVLSVQYQDTPFGSYCEYLLKQLD